MIRARTALVCAVSCDLVLLLAAPPLLQYSIAASRSPESTVAQIAMLLCANVLLLLICLCGAVGWVYVAERIGRSGLHALWAAINATTKQRSN